MSRMAKRRRWLVMAAAAGAAAFPARADQQAITIPAIGTYPPLGNNGFNYYQPPGGYTFTWDFTANSAIRVTQLGYYDSALAGTPEPGGDFGTHTLSLVDLTTLTTLATTTVDATSAATGFFNYATIGPITLNTTDTYEVSGTMTTQYYAVGVNEAAAPLAPQINYIYTPTNIFGTPGPPNTYADFGPNFQFTAAVACTENVTGNHVIALAGDACKVTPGAYNPTTSAAVLPVVYNGFGLYAHGGTITSPGAISITTTDPNGTGGSYGAWADGAGSVINLNGATTVTTVGVDSYGVYASGGGQIAAATLNASTTGVNAYGLYASGAGSSISATGGSISTSANVTQAVNADAGGAVTLNGGAVSTSGTGSWGLSTNGAGSKITATGVTVTTTGGIDPSGNVALGGFARNGSTVSLVNDVISTSGLSAHGLEAGGGSSITVSGGSVTTGANNAYGLFSTDAGSSITTSNGASIATSGFDAFGVAAFAGGRATLTGGSVGTSGGGAWALLASGAGSNITATGVTVTTTGGFDTSGNVSLGAFAQSGSTMILTNDAFTTNGDGAHGLEAGGASSIAVTGGSVTTRGANAVGLFSTDAGSLITASNGVAVATSGQASYGVEAMSGAGARVTGSSVITAGDCAHAIFVTDAGSTVTLSGANGLTTSGDGAVGVLAASGGVVTASGATTISTTGTNSPINGLSSFGVNADGAGAAITLGAATISTTGGGAIGLLASDRGATGAGGVITVNGALNVTTQSAFAYDVFATGAGSQIALNGTSTLNVGSGAFGLYATAGGAITTSAGLTIIDSAAGFGGAVEADSGSSITLGGTSTITLASTGVVGLFATPGGTITSNGALTVNAGNNTGVLAQGGTINLGQTTVSADSLWGLEAASGGKIVASGLVTVTETGASGGGSGAVVASGAGASIALNGGATLNVSADRAAGLAAASGGVVTGKDVTIITSGANDISLTALGGSSLALTGTTNLSLSGAGSFGLRVQPNAPLTISGPTTITLNGANEIGVALQSGGAFSTTQALTITSAQTSSAAIRLNGSLSAGASFSATGGGAITSAGDAIQLLGGPGLSATFDNFNIASGGDLIFADPSNSTVNFNSTTANAGTGNLIDATAGSTVTLNANASTMTGKISTDATSTTNVALTNGTVWNVTGDSTVSNLMNANSSIVFSPTLGPATKALTLGAYAGNGGLIALNTTLGGSTSPSDHIVMTGPATGSTTLLIRNAGGTGGQTTGSGIPIVLVTGAGSTAPGAFALAGPLVVNGYQYTLGRDANTQDWSLASQVASTQSQIDASVNAVSQARQSQMITTRLLSSILIGQNEQINCSSCASGFGAIGSYAIGAHGRWSLNDRLTLLAGFSLDGFHESGWEVDTAPMVAASLRYDLVDWGASRPFFEAGASAAPYEPTNFTRTYAYGAGTQSSKGFAIERDAAVFGRVGWVGRVSPIEEYGVWADLSHSWQQSGPYAETAIGNPFPATYGGGVDAMNVARLGGQYTRLMFSKLEVNVNAAYAEGFGGVVGQQANVAGFGPSGSSTLGASGWLEYGARLGYRVSSNLIIDGFVLGTLGPQPAGDTIHGGLGVRASF